MKKYALLDRQNDEVVKDGIWLTERMKENDNRDWWLSNQPFEWVESEDERRPTMRLRIAHRPDGRVDVMSNTVHYRNGFSIVGDSVEVEDRDYKKRVWVRHGSILIAVITCDEVEHLERKE